MALDDRRVWENLSEWDNLDNPLAPLTDEQQQSILELASLCSNRLHLQDEVICHKMTMNITCKMSNITGCS